MPIDSAITAKKICQPRLPESINRPRALEITMPKAMANVEKFLDDLKTDLEPFTGLVYELHLILRGEQIA